SDHNGHQAAYMQQWDGTKWVKISDWIDPMKSEVRPLLEAAANDYVTKNAGWPKRTEKCDKPSSRKTTNPALERGRDFFFKGFPRCPRPALQRTATTFSPSIISR